jgi:hypothetical protein
MAHDEECCPVGPGGDTTIVNQDEQMILDRTTQACAVRTEGMQESGRH